MSNGVVRSVSLEASSRDDRPWQYAGPVALKECTSTMRRLVSAMGSAERGIGREPRTGGRPLPAGMTAWVRAADVAQAAGCSRSKAHEYPRAAAARSVRTGQLLRVSVDVWEAWAR